MNNYIYNGIIIDPSEFLMPKIRVSPLDQTALVCPKCKDVENVLPKIKDFHGKHVAIGIKARQLIEYALLQCNLKPNDTVTVLTTSGNLYVSNCITKEVEKFCKWSRLLSDKTKAIIVNHEFGYAYPYVKDLLKYNVPIIEDCAQSFLTEADDIGVYGDFAIYSLPKTFPMQIGAVLASKKAVDYPIDKEKLDYIKIKISQHADSMGEIREKRLANYQYLKDNLQTIGIKPFFEMKDGIVPGVFLCQWHECINYQKLKDFLTNNGIECSVFYGKNAFFIPLHHNLSKSELDYMIQLIHYFYENMV